MRSELRSAQEALLGGLLRGEVGVSLAKQNYLAVPRPLAPFLQVPPCKPAYFVPFQNGLGGGGCAVKTRKSPGEEKTGDLPIRERIRIRLRK